MKVVILAGGRGTRISEESYIKPKPMVEIGEQPILWHIMKTYAHFGFTDFIICLGYKGFVIKQFFANYILYQSDVTIDLSDNSMTMHQNRIEPWRITLVDTGYETQTGGRLKQIAPYLQGEAAFCMTYGDGLADIDIRSLVAFHQSQGLLATITAVQPPGRFGALTFDGNKVTAFSEKPKGDGGYINGGFFVLSPKVLDRISSDDTVWEAEPLESLSVEGQLGVYTHNGFWQPMDTLRDKNHLEKLWASGNAPWKVWD